MSIRALDHFAKSDTHATQYSLIAQSLLTTALTHLEKRELQERHRRTESSSQLFGLIPHDGRSRADDALQDAAVTPANIAAAASETGGPVARSPFRQRQTLPSTSPGGGDVESGFFGWGDSVMGPDLDFLNMYQNDGDVGSAFNLFPLLDAGGGIDLAHYP